MRSPEDYYRHTAGRKESLQKAILERNQLREQISQRDAEIQRRRKMLDDREKTDHSR